ncbi:MAG TPA: sigma-54 dependent transcriptional regulator [Bdellovibrionota bacterium]|nr:sigma-54 dependent transcriptional regulator [Bdellovibrionota bacterium]
MSRILIVDDDAELRRSLCTALSDPHEVDEAEDGLGAMEKVRAGGVHLVILDMDMPRMGGMDTLRAIKKHDPRTIVLILTAYSTIQDAVAATREGAYNYLQKPIRHADIRDMVERALKAHDLVAQVAYSAPIFTDETGTKLSSRSGGMQKVFTLIEKLANVDTAVLLRGESGTGKEVVARAIHFNSLRKDGRFVAVNCSAIPETLIESELFGHEKGAFTGADQRKIGKFQFADSGTIFLDEIGDISPSMQVKLLRVLQEKCFMPVGSNREVEANVRVIAATNRNLEEMMKAGTFREDLYYRLNVLPIYLPPLRERVEDIEMLVQHFVRKFNVAHKKEIQGIDAPALARLKTHSWPGNIRELENVIEHTFVLESGKVITEFSLPESLRPVEGMAADVSPVPVSAPSADGSAAEELDFPSFKERYERDFIVRALRRFNGKINQTSAHTNIPKKTLLRKIEKYKINTEEFKTR